jgi:hypothetical protein
MKQLKTIVVSHIILQDGTISGVSMYRHHYRRDKIRRLFLLENIL